MFIDPWQLHIDGFLTLDTYGRYQANISETAPAIYLTGTDINRTMETQEHYIYEKLNPREIRLLEISPGKDDMPLEGIIHHVSMDSRETFWAISYVWGAAPTTILPFHFKTTSGIIPITASLHSALRAIRKKEASTLLWADAISINQADSVEKSIQIRLLRPIFQLAERVIAWIGNEGDNSYEAIEALKQIKGSSQASKISSCEINLASVPSGGAKNDSPSLTDQNLEGIERLLERSWFRRIWIVQEVVVSSKIFLVCGRSEISWDDFFEALEICEGHLNPEDCKDNSRSVRNFPCVGPVYALGKTRRKFKNERRRYTLLELLELFAHTKATQERDKLFALLGLASDAGDDAFNPDYDSPLEEIVQRYSLQFIWKGYAMDLLYRAGKSKAYPFCSWIPCWTREEYPKTISNWATTQGRFYSGPKFPPSAKPLYSDPTVLVVNGFSIDSILRTTNIRINTREIISVVDNLRALIGYLKDYPTGENCDELMLKLPIGDAKGPYTHSEGPQDLLMTYNSLTESEEESWPLDLGKELSSISLDQNVTNFQGQPQHTRETFLKYCQTAEVFANRISNGTFCVTKRGYAGLVPGDAEKGDEICVFDGGAVPFILRKNQPEKRVRKYALIGECYIHGIMYGEALKFKDIKEKEFSLV
jgi:hypothetical protein